MNEKLSESDVHLRKEGEIIPQGVSITCTHIATYIYQRRGKRIVCVRIPYDKETNT